MKEIKTNTVTAIGSDLDISNGIRFLYKTMRSKKRARVKAALKLMDENREKYCDLVWYARNCGRNHLENENYEALNIERVIENKYPEEVAKIGKDDNWHHGFNSGMLAASRLYGDMIEMDVEYALEYHPNLDT